MNMHEFFKLLKKLMKDGFTIGESELLHLIEEELESAPLIEKDGESFILKQSGARLKVEMEYAPKYAEEVVKSLLLSYSYN